MINDYFRSLKQQNFLIMESTPSLVNWHAFNRAKRPGQHRLAALQFLAQGQIRSYTSSGGNRAVLLKSSTVRWWPKMVA